MANGSFDSTFVIAVYGAVLSSTIFLFDLFKYITDRPKLEVKTTLSLFYENGAPKKEIKKICVEMINSGKRPITLLCCGFRIKTDSIMNTQQIVDLNLPKKLSEAEAYVSCTDFTEGDATKIIYAWAKDATGKEFKSVKWPLKDFA
jgi:hypothetical protein